MFKLIVAGSRSFNDYDLLKRKLDHLLANKDLATVHIVSGTARGADQLGERYAKERGCQLDLFPANWARYGRSAGYERNARMASHADALVAFWDGSSPGTRNMITTMQTLDKPGRLVEYDNPQQPLF